MYLGCLRRVGWTLGSVAALVLGCNAEATEEQEARCEVPGYGAIDLADVAAGEGGFVIVGEAAEDGAGSPVAGAGDMNGDGLDDVIVGAIGAAGEDGRAYVVFGKANTDAVALASVVEGEGGFVLDGEGFSLWTGWPLSGAGDVNGDGLPDVIVGSHGPSAVVFGKEDTGAVALSEVAEGGGGFLLYPGEERAINSLAGVGDMNGDGLDDMVAATGFHLQGDPRVGSVYVVFGKTDTQAVLLADMDEGVGGFVLEGDWDASSVSGAGDVNGDGVVDLVVGVDDAEPNGEYSGRAYVVFGKADTGTVALSDVAAGVGGFVLDGEAGGDQAGMRVSDAGDVNGDGLDDVIIGAPWKDLSGDGDGRAYVVFGKADTTALPLSDVATGKGGFALDGGAPDDRLGIGLGAVGDINGDGLADIVVGAPLANPNGDQTGRTYVVFGKADTEPVLVSNVAAGIGGFVLDGEAGGHGSGGSVAGAGDINGDGIPDLIIEGADHVPMGSPANGDSAAREEPGRAYVFFGGDFSCPVEETGTGT